MNSLKQKWHSPQKKKKKKTSAALLWLSREKEHMKRLYIRSLTKKEVYHAFWHLGNYQTS